MNMANGVGLDFEQPVLALDRKIAEMKAFAAENGLDLESDLARLAKKREQLLSRTHRNMSAWNRIEIARRQGRPYALDHIQATFTDFVELHGDRAFGDDPAIVAGFARLDGEPVCIVAHQKGKDTRENIHRNFGMPHPEGYRKALRVMKLAERFGRPVICLVDTPGAFPGIGAEERGQAQAIAENILEMSSFRVPVVVAVLGEGASGGALGIGVGDRLLMFENSWYCVISPEGCAAILWGDRLKAREVADHMKLTGRDLADLGLVDRVVEEPAGGAHWDSAEACKSMGRAISQELAPLRKLDPEELVRARLERYSRIGVFLEGAVLKDHG
ncbi:MAG TPA: acetyl-CoA carboxylase carboxyltransferase subunit alpha [Fibrobacteria bacterium]|nr:acetyl-CoA carboxylase carboxyltransferase subunit alpha [Fibrobacteria bacterium]